MLFDTLSRLGFSIIIFYLFQAVTDLNLTLAYTYTAILTILLYLSILLRHSCSILVELTMSRLKAGFMMLLYTKISKMTSFSIKSAEIGKITNLIANDLGIFSMRFVNFIFAASFVILCIGLTVLLIVRIGWAGVISVVIVLLYLPLTNKISQANGEFIKEINGFKDRRVKLPQKSSKASNTSNFTVGNWPSRE